MPCGMCGTPVAPATPTPPAPRAVAGPRARAWAGVLAALALGGCSSEAPRRPDLFLITVDALAADRLACFGGPPDAGRALCDLARGGVVFAWAASGTGAETSSAASLMTGEPVDRHPVDDDGAAFLPERFATLAETLAAAGYATGAFVASPRLNRSRRLDQGFQRYDDAFARRPGPSGQALAEAVEAWLDAADRPRFAWVHASAGDGLDDLERLVTRLSPRLAARPTGPAVLFAALGGEPVPGQRIEWRRHRVPLIFRAAGASAAGAPRSDRRLVTLEDVRPTLLAGARIPDGPDTRGRSGSAGLDLASPAPDDASPDDPRRVLLRTARRRGEAPVEVGLATPLHLYARRLGSSDGDGTPLPSEKLRTLDARWLSLRSIERDGSGAGSRASIRAGDWRSDLVGVESPVPRLEFHLARRLAVAPSQENR